MSSITPLGLFSRLPYELREPIWLMVVEADVDMRLKGPSYRNQLGLLRASSAVHHEVRSLVYEDRTISIAAGPQQGSSSSLCPPVALLHPHRAPLSIFEACGPNTVCPAALNCPIARGKPGTCYCKYNGQLYLKALPKVCVELTRLGCQLDMVEAHDHLQTVADTLLLSRRGCSPADLSGVDIRIAGRAAHEWRTPGPQHHIFSAVQRCADDEFEVPIKRLAGPISLMACTVGTLVYVMTCRQLAVSVAFEVPQHWVDALTDADLPPASRWLDAAEEGKRMLCFEGGSDWWCNFGSDFTLQFRQKLSNTYV